MANPVLPAVRGHSKHGSTNPASYVLNGTAMNILGQIDAGHPPYQAMALIGVVAVITLFVAFKVAKFVFKAVFVLTALAVIGGLVWWFFLRR